MDSGKLSRPPPKGWWKWPVGVFLGVGVIAALAGPPKEGEREGQSVSATRSAGIAIAQMEAKPASGEHCLSDWDGANRDLVRQVKVTMREPGSFEHIDTRIYGNDNGEHGLWMTFRARNGFGGMNIEKVYARIDHESCNALRFGEGPGI